MAHLLAIAFRLVTFGLPPDRRSTLIGDWVDYMVEFSKANGKRSTVFEVLRGLCSHMWWRLTASNEVTAVPSGSACFVTGSGASLYVLANDPSAAVSGAADLHIGLALAFLGFVLLARPWQLLPVWVPLAFLCVASGVLHVAIEVHAVRWFDYALLLGLVTAAVGCAGVGVDGLISATPLGRRRSSLMATNLGAVVIGVAELLWATTTGGLVYAIASAIVGLGMIAFSYQFFLLWRANLRRSPA